MNRRHMLTSLGFATVASASAAVANTSNKDSILSRLSARDANLGEVTVWGGPVDTEREANDYESWKRDSWSWFKKARADNRIVYVKNKDTKKFEKITLREFIGSDENITCKEDVHYNFQSRGVNVRNHARYKDAFIPFCGIVVE